jgi:hypothetical protein
MTKITVKIDCKKEICGGCHFQRCQASGNWMCNCFSDFLKLDEKGEKIRLPKCKKSETMKVK